MTYKELLEKYRRRELGEAEERRVEAEIEKHDAISEYLADCLEEELYGAAQRKLNGETEAGQDDLKHRRVNCVSEAEQKDGAIQRNLCEIPEVDQDESLEQGMPGSGNANTEISKYKVKSAQKKTRSIPGAKQYRAYAATDLEFEKYVKKAIRRSLCKVGIGVGTGIFAVLLLIQFALSPLISSIYYDPSKQIEVVSEDGNSAMIFNQMTMDLNAYAELVLPGKTGPQVSAFPQGYGTYSIMISPVISYGTMRQQSVGGQVSRGKLQLYDPNFLEGMPANTFACFGMDPESEMSYREQLETPNTECEGERISGSQWFYRTVEESRAAVEALTEDKPYVAYVSLAEKLNFKEMYEMLDRIIADTPEYMAALWLGVHAVEDLHFSGGCKGYYYDRSGVSLPYSYNETYPEISFSSGAYEEEDYWENIEKKRRNEDTMTRHFVSLLRYMGDQEQFLELMDSVNGTVINMANRPQSFRQAADFVEENGLSYYGFACVTTKADMLRMLEAEEILGIVPVEYQ